VETEKRNSLIKAWEENEKTKAENKYVTDFYTPVCIFSHVINMKNELTSMSQGFEEAICYSFLGEHKESKHRSSTEED
jgi:hypothetical protein